MRRTIRRLRNNDRQRLIRAKIVKPQHDGLEERKTIERQWERIRGLQQQLDARQHEITIATREEED